MWPVGIFTGGDLRWMIIRFLDVDGGMAEPALDHCRRAGRRGCVRMDTNAIRPTGAIQSSHARSTSRTHRRRPAAFADGGRQRSIQQDPPRRISILHSDHAGKAINRLEINSITTPRRRAAGRRFGHDEHFRQRGHGPDGARVAMRGSVRLHRQGDEECMPVEFTSETLTLLIDEDVVRTDAAAADGNSVMKGDGMQCRKKT
jgi:hypothetical protein